jgi:AcrR family transcriptional regulator
LHKNENLCNTGSIVTTTRRGGDTRSAILDATDRLLTTAGFRRITMDDIAAEAGVSRRTIYMYFPSKDEVGLSSIDRVVEGTHDHLMRLAEAGGDPAEILRRVLIERVLYRIDSVNPYRKSLDELFEAVRPAYMARRKRHLEREAVIIAGVLEAGQARGRFAFDDAAATATTLVRATNAFLPYSLSVQELGERDRIEEGVRRMADLLLKSLISGARGERGATVKPRARRSQRTMPRPGSGGDSHEVEQSDCNVGIDNVRGGVRRRRDHDRRGP